jgi:hypothetical protein
MGHTKKIPEEKQTFFVVRDVCRGMKSVSIHYKPEVVRVYFTYWRSVTGEEIHLL